MAEINSKITKYQLEADTVALRQQGLSLQQIADELNASGKVPNDDLIDKFVVKRFLDNMPEVQREIVQSSRKRLVQAVNSKMDVIHEVGTMYNRTKQLLEHIEEQAYENNKLPSVNAWKLLSSEMTVYLRLMMDIQKEINTYDNVKKFMEVVINSVRKNAPEALPVILQELKDLQGARWFADSFK